MLDLLFKFPIVMVDGDMEEKKHRLDLPSDNGELDMIVGEAKVPYSDFVGMVDRWLPTAESRERAAEGNFDACQVIFAVSGTYLVPWPKERFEEEIIKFGKAYLKKNPPVQMLTKKDMKELYDQLEDGE